MFSGRLSDKGMNQVSDSNAIQWQIALRTLEERCLKLTKRADSLQDENERLLTSRSELLAEVERLQEQQIRLREKNLRLNREYHSKQQECSLLAEKLTSFARGRVGNFKLGSDIVAGLTELREDNEGSADSLETVELQGASVSKQGNFDHAKRTLSEPNLSVIQCELDKVRKGLWSRTTVESDSYVADNSASKAENVFKPEIQSLDVGIQRTDQLRNTDYIFADPSDPPIFIEACTDNANILYGKLQNQNEILRRLMQSLKINQGNIFF